MVDCRSICIPSRVSGFYLVLIFVAFNLEAVLYIVLEENFFLVFKKGI